MASLITSAEPCVTLRVCLRLLWTRKWTLLLTMILLIGGTATTLLIPPLLGRLVDVVIDGQSLSEIVLICAGLLGAGILGAGAEYLGGLLLVGCLQSALSRLREEVFSAALHLPLDVVEESGSSEIVSRVTGDVEAVTDAVSGVLPNFLQAGFTIALTAVGLTFVDPWLGLAALIAVPVQVLATVLFLRRSRPLYVWLRAQESERGQSILESATGSSMVHAYGVHDQRLADTENLSTRAIATQVQTAKVRNRFQGGLNLAEFLGLMSILVVGFWRVTSVGLSIGSVTAGALFFHRLFGPIGALLGSIDDLQRAQAGLERLVGVLELERKLQQTVGNTEIRSAEVVIREVSHWYPGAQGPPALEDVELEIADGSTVAFVGVSGSGKSTLARLVAGIGRLSHGQILVGGADAHSAVRQSRPAVSLVTQESHIFTGTVSDNLRLGAPTASDEELWGAFATVGILPSDHHLDAGLDTELTDQADSQLIQLIALSRIVLADPAVVILDEATSMSGVDRKVSKAVSAVVDNRTAIVIAHRLSDIANADQVVVFDHGRIVEQGTPDALLQTTNSSFAKLWRAWSEPPKLPSR